MSDMANNDLEKYAKALDKYEICLFVWASGLTRLHQRDHEVPFVEDGRGERYHETPLEQDVPRHRSVASARYGWTPR